MLRPVGMPIPVGFLALMTASGLFAVEQLGGIPASETHQLGWAVLAFAVPLQLLGSVFGFLARDPVAGTGMGLLAATWAATGVLTVQSAPGATSSTLGVVLLLGAVALLVPATAGTGKLAAATVLALASARFAVTGVYELTSSSAWKSAAGIVGLVVSAAALYGALAFELEGAHGRTVLPTGRAEPVQDLNEPGVRSSL